MGTTSGGASGSGSGMRAGGGEGWDYKIGGYTSSKGEMKPQEFDTKKIESEIIKVLKALFSKTSTYLIETFTNKYTDQVFKELFFLSKLLHQNNSTEIISKEYDLNMNEPGFIFNLIDKIDKKFEKIEIDSRCIQNTRITLEHFLFKVMENDAELAVVGNGNEVINVMTTRNDIWKSTSGYFLSTLLETVFLKEIERKVPRANYEIQRQLIARANKVIENYESQNQPPKTNYKELFKYISNNWESFKVELTK